MRKSARNQSLPHEEAETLRKLSGRELKARCYNLFKSGWTLSAIGSPLDRGRSTVRAWVATGPYPLQPTPAPEDRTYVPRKKPNPGLTSDEKSTLQYLGPDARKYRARLPESHPATLANRELTHLCVTFYEAGVPIQEIADATGVTYRAMYRRVKNVR